MTETTDLCVRCKYELRGIANDQPCPECGLLAERSRHLGERLRDTDPAYLRRLSIGVWLLVSLPFLLIGELVLIAVIEETGSMRGFDPQLLLLGVTAISVLFAVSIWLLTATDRAADRGYLAWVLRHLALIPLSCMLLVHLSTYIVRTSQMGGAEWELSAKIDTFAELLIDLWLIAFPAMLFTHLRRIARRLLSSHMMEHSVIVGVGTSMTALAILLTSMLASHGRSLGLPEPHRNAQWPMVLLATLMALAGLFAIWIMYLLIRFAIAFIIESRALRKRWRDADRSGVTFPPG